MNDAEKKAFKEELMSGVGSMMDEKLKGLQPASGNPAPTSKDPAPTGDPKPATDPKVTAMEKQLSEMQENTKADRIEQITELADAKGLSDEEKKPLIAMLKARSAIELCDNSEGGIFASTRAMLSSRPDKQEGKTGDSIFQSLEFADTKGNKVTVDDPSTLALKTGF